MSTTDAEEQTVTTRRPSRRSTRTVTLHDVAKVAGVSTQTVSRAIRDRQLVSEDAYERVQRAIELTGYVRNLAASNLASNRSMSVAAIIPVISVSIFADAVHQLEDVLADAGYGLLLATTNYELQHEEEVIRTFLGRRPDGFFVVGTRHTPTATLLLERANVPIVETWDLNDHPMDCLVGYSNSDAAEAIVEYAIDKGYRHPTFGGGLGGEFRTAARLEGFTRAMRRRLPGEPIRSVQPDNKMSGWDTGQEILADALARYPETDVLICSSDNIAAGALLECQRRGIDVPGRLAITGFGDFEMARHLVPGLTSVATPNDEIGRRGGELLLQRMSGELDKPTTIDVGYTIVPRGSA